MENKVIDNEFVEEEQTEEYLDLTENFKEIKEDSKKLVQEDNLFGLSLPEPIEGLMSIDLSGDNPELFDSDLVMEF